MTCNIKTRSIHHLILIISCGIAMVSCRKDELEMVEKTPCEPLLKALSFKASSNPYQLVEDVRCEIIGDSMVECRVGHMVIDKVLVPHFEFQGDGVLVDGRPVRSDETRLDFRKPVRMTVVSGSLRKDYTVNVHSFTGLPVVWVETEGRREITSKEEYLRASFQAGR